jgi:hypothetical protein
VSLMDGFERGVAADGPWASHSHMCDDASSGRRSDGGSLLPTGLNKFFPSQSGPGHESTFSEGL